MTHPYICPECGSPGILNVETGVSLCVACRHEWRGPTVHFFDTTDDPDEDARRVHATLKKDLDAAQPPLADGQADE